MAKRKTRFVCQSCGYESPKWLGKCNNCSEWNTLVEEAVPTGSASRLSVPRSVPVPLSAISDDELSTRIPSGIGELDRVLGNGIFPASVVLLAGEPGIGKSTLMLQAMLKLRHSGRKALYVSGEESAAQIRNRSMRLKEKADDLLVLTETDVTAIEHHITQTAPQIVVVDSAQAIYNPDFSGAPGNIGQVRECAARLFQLAKTQGFVLFLIGHVTKDGNIAGPKILEHLVDVVVYFEANTQQHRIIRAVKNRFGAANELGIFEMRGDGLREVRDAGGLFFNAHDGPVIGSSVVCSYEGSRPLLVEIQALVNRSNYGTPQRTVSGFDQRRLALILAVLEKYCRLNFGLHDVFVKVAGGLRISDPGIDLGVAAALHSSLQDAPLENDAVYIGELGLGGEVRPVAFIEQRLNEAQKMGLRKAYVPAKTIKDIERRSEYRTMLTPIHSVEALIRSAGD